MRKHLLKHLDELKGLFKDKKLSVFLDFDGTLAPIVARPELARVSYPMKEVLRTLMSRYPVAVVTGRGLKDIKERLKIKNLVYAANHGMEIWSKDYVMICDVGEISAELKGLEKALKQELKEFKGVIIENKGATMSVHYRLVDVRDENAFLRKARGYLRGVESEGTVRVTEGKKVLEVRPPIDWHKGRAVQWIMEKEKFVGTCPIYIGDDYTDFDGFRAVAGCGVSVYVGSTGGTEGEPDYYLKSQMEVKRFLKWLKDLS